MKNNNRFDLKGKIKNYYHYYYLFLLLVNWKKIYYHRRKIIYIFKKILKNITTWIDKLNIIINVINIIKFINISKFTINIITIEKNIDFDFRGKINFYYYINYYYYY